MWGHTSGAKHRSHYANYGTAAGSNGDASGSSSRGERADRDEAIVITATALPPALPPNTISSPAVADTHPAHIYHAVPPPASTLPYVTPSMGLQHRASTSSGGAAAIGLGSGAAAAAAVAAAAAGTAGNVNRVASMATLPTGGADSGSLSSMDELVRSAQASALHRSELCDSGLPDAEMCSLADAPPSVVPVVQEALSRGQWLLGLLIVQSTSSFVLDYYQDLLRDHLVVTLFLTMLVGAGGNAGNQSAIKVIRGLATGAIKPSWRSARNTLREQALVGVMLGTGLSLGGFVRVYATHGDVTNAFAISVSLFLIVMTSVVLGSGLPFVLARAGVDPANAGTSIQVLMDILGVAITCVTCNLVLVQLAAGLAG